jgi:hypothetical protein
MVDPVDKLSHAIAALRAQRLAAQRGQQRRSATKPAPQAAAADPARRSDALKHAIAQAVAAIDPQAEDRRQRARRVFVEQVLQFEFGRDIRLDRQFGNLVKRVAADLGSDEAGAAELDAQIEQLAQTLAPRPAP